MKLYKVPKNSKIKIMDKYVVRPVASPIARKDDILHFSHCDGMYSYCTDANGNVVHISRMTEVEIVGQNDGKHEKR